MPEIRFARLADLRPLMAFMDAHWRAGHILSVSEDLFRFDFQDGDRLNLALACDGSDIIGIFGFMRYSSLDCPDLAGSLWKVVDGRGSPMLGLQLRRFVVDRVAHRYFAAPGAGLQTRPIYRVLGMQWIEMDHYVAANPDVREQRICRIADATAAPTLAVEPGADLEPVASADVLADFPFLDDSGGGPQKDFAYLRRRFFAHPIYAYRVFRLVDHGETLCVVVCREVGHDGHKALRVVDFYGDPRHMADVVRGLFQVVVAEGFEYADFVCSGFDPVLMQRAGWRRLDFDRQDVVVPNYFEPFVRKNVRVYAVADTHPGIRPRLCRADGDQDRPNVLRSDALSLAS
ncbi:MAG: hypothetical protein QNJ91_04300 [Gammaproteobacteria bacterium]|nr:hypothetical protein [Gammaproteobacteria bacterium]